MNEPVKCVYVAVHERMPNLVKIGRSRVLKERISVLNTALPEDFNVVLVYKTEAYKKLENKIIEELKNKNLHRGSRNTKEFFECDKMHIKRVIDKIVASDTNLQGVYLNICEIQELLRRKR